jgi:inorganic pyrophosphatase
MNVRVFVQNEAGSNQKHYHDENTLEWKGVATVSRTYPFPYGFIVGTSAADGCNVDCFVLSEKPLKTGELVDCEIVGLMEQFEDGLEDHNILAVLPGKRINVDDDIQRALSDFVMGVFEHMPNKRITVGRFAGPTAAASFVASRSDR